MIPLLYITFGGFLVAMAAPALVRHTRDHASWLLALFPASVLVILLGLMGPPSSGALMAGFSWIPSLGIDVSFFVDGLSVLFVLLITGIGTVVVIYAGAYLRGRPNLGRFYLWLFVFMGSMIGVVTSGNLLVLFVFWELTSISSYFLIGFTHDEASSRRAALQALLITGAGGLSLLAGLILLGQAVGSYELADVLASGEVFRSSDLYLPALLLILGGVFTKSAQLPFHFWLPNAMAAPTPVSAYLHSATMVKAGVFLLARLHPVLNGTDVFHGVVGTVGAATMIFGAAVAFGQNDLKRILAYTTISALGTLVLLLGIGTETAVQAAVVFLLAHALYKGAMFLIVGIVDHEAGTRDVTKLGGLRSVMAKTTIAAVLAALSMAGLPPMLGFLSKELLYEAKIAAPFAPWAISTVGMAANALMVATAALVVLRTFWGKLDASHRTLHDPPFGMWAGALALAVPGFLAGLLAEKLATTLIEPAVAAIRGEHVDLKLALWHGINPVLLLSLLTLAAGAGIYLMHRPIRAFVQRWKVWKADSGYDAGMNGFLRIARWQTLLLQNGKLSRYLAVTVAAMLILFAIPVIPVWSTLRIPFTVYPALVPAVIAAVTAITAMLAVRARSPLGAIIALGVVGYAMAIIFLLYSAPDLAITQFAVETLTVILLMLVVRRLPKFTAYATRRTRTWHAMLAGLSGVVMTLLVLLVTAQPNRTDLARYYAEMSYLAAQGRNIVNVILVDFRGLDTLGEITVLAIGAVGAYGLLKLVTGKERDA